MSYRLNNLSELFTWIAEEELPRRFDAGLATVYMCFCAESAARRGLCDGDLWVRAEAHLMARLYPELSYSSWLRKRHPDIASLPDSNFHGRVAWARALAEEFRG